jgi:hypothetical protein
VAVRQSARPPDELITIHSTFFRTKH